MRARVAGAQKACDVFRHHDRIIDQQTERNHKSDDTQLIDIEAESVQQRQADEQVTVGGVRIGLTGATYDDSARASDPGDLKFLPSVATLITQARELRGEGADFVVAVAHVTREQGYELYRSDTIDLILTGRKEEVDRVALEQIRKAGFGSFLRHRTGHGCRNSPSDTCGSPLRCGAHAADQGWGSRCNQA